MADRLRISGISTGYDTAQLIEQLMAVERRPVLLMQKQQSQIKTRSDAWRDVASRLSSLKSKAAALKSTSVFNVKSVTSSADKTVSAAADSAAAAGTYKVWVDRLATATRATGAAELGRGLDMGAKLAEAGFSLTPTAGTFTINGVQIRIDAVINIVGGIIIGIVQLGLSAGDAFQRFALLTVGGGLVNQIPALLISTATGIVVTRAASESDLGRDVTTQMLAQPRALSIAAGLLLLLGMVPGLPKAPFLILASAVGFLAYRVTRSAREAEQAAAVPHLPMPGVAEPEDVMSLLRVEPMELNFGYALIPLVDVEQGGDLKERVAAVRRQIALELGIVVPSVRIRDDIQARSNEYIVRIRGVEVDRGEVIPDAYMAMNPGTATEQLDGIQTREPAFGLPAVWVSAARRAEAEMMGYTVVDPASVIATHLSEIIKANAAELLSRQDTRNLIDNVKKTAPAVVEDLIPAQMSVGEVQRVLQNLVRERISIRDLITILEALGDAAGTYKDIDVLTEYVRSRMGRSICSQYAGPDGMAVTTLEPSLEQILMDSLDATDHGAFLAPEPAVYRALIASLAAESEHMAANGQQPIVLTSTNLRPHLRRLVERTIPQLVVLSYSEIVPEVKVNAVGMVSLGNAS